jgi:hypothetical protein
MIYGTYKHNVNCRITQWVPSFHIKINRHDNRNEQHNSNKGQYHFLLRIPFGHGR